MSIDANMIVTADATERVALPVYQESTDPKALRIVKHFLIFPADKF